jgi:hypothetical protein
MGVPREATKVHKQAQESCKGIAKELQMNHK